MVYHQAASVSRCAKGKVQALLVTPDVMSLLWVHNERAPPVQCDRGEGWEAMSRWAALVAMLARLEK